MIVITAIITANISIITMTTIINITTTTTIIIIIIIIISVRWLGRHCGCCVRVLLDLGSL